jgi:hypothetical protein
LTNTGCDPATGECYEGYGLGYANAGGCPGCTACHVCDNVNGWTFVAFREGGCVENELNSNFDPAGCKQWVECDPFNGCSDLGYTLSLGANPFEGTCADGVCTLRNTGCEPYVGCNQIYTVAASPYNYEGPCPLCEECVVCVDSYGVAFVFFSENCAAEGYESGGYNTCSARYQCNSTNGNCDFIGYYSDSTAPYGSTDLSTCETTCTLTNTGCDPYSGHCLQGYGLGYANAGGCPECVVTNTGCDPSTGACDQVITAAGAGYPNPGGCPDCSLTNTGCDPATGACDEGYGLGYANAGGCPECSLTNTGCDPATGECYEGYGLGYANPGGCLPCVECYVCDPDAYGPTFVAFRESCNPEELYGGQEDDCMRRTSSCDFESASASIAGLCAVKNTTDASTYTIPYAEVCMVFCAECFVCDPLADVPWNPFTGSATYVGTRDYYCNSGEVGGGSNRFDYRSLLECKMRNTGCDPAGGTCSQLITFDSSFYPYEGPCDPECKLRNTGCHPVWGCEQAFTTDSSSYPNEGPCSDIDCVSRGFVCDNSLHCQGERYGASDSPLAGPATCEECVSSYVCYDNQCGFSGYYDINSLPPGYFASEPACQAACSA